MRLAFALLLAAGCSAPTIHGSGRRVTVERAVSGFDRVTFRAVGEVTLIQGDEEGLSIEIDDNLLRG
ncbi:MAG: hypothetical protein ACYTGN_09170 [Planctomycetota bacterium]